MKTERILKVLFTLIMLMLAVAWLTSTPTRSVHAQLAGGSGFQWVNITTGTNTVVKGGPGMFYGIVVNGGTLTGNITIVDTAASGCTGGTAFAVIGEPQTIGQMITYNAQMVKGICITTAAAANVTAMYR